MKVKEIIKELSKYNEEAEFYIVVNGEKKPSEICYGGGDGCTPESCQSVVFMVDTPTESTK